MDYADPADLRWVLEAPRPVELFNYPKHGKRRISPHLALDQSIERVLRLSTLCPKNASEFGLCFLLQPLVIQYPNTFLADLYQPLALKPCEVSGDNLSNRS